MMRLVAFFRGHCRLEITGVEPSRCLNRFLGCGVGFWDLATPDAYTLQCSILARDLDAAAQIARGCQCQARCLARHGFAHRYGGLVRRPMLLVSLALLLVGILVLPNFIWTLEVQGNVTVPTAQILQELDNIGVRFGTWGPGLSNREIKNKMLLRIPALQWLAVNCSGGKATVLVAERTESDRVISKREVTNLVAACDGVISQVQVYSGAAQLDHLLFALGHILGHDQLRQAIVLHFLFDEKFRLHPGHLAAGSQNAVGDRAHQAGF